MRQRAGGQPRRCRHRSNAFAGRRRVSGLFCRGARAYVDGTATNTVTSTPVAFNARGLTIDTPVAVSLLVPGDSILRRWRTLMGSRSVRWPGGEVAPPCRPPRLHVGGVELWGTAGGERDVRRRYGPHRNVVVDYPVAFQDPVGSICGPAWPVDDGAEGRRQLLSPCVSCVGWLPFDVLVDGTAVSSGFAMDYYGLSARAEGETVTVRGTAATALRWTLRLCPWRLSSSRARPSSAARCRRPFEALPSCLWSSTLTGLSRAVGRWACTFFRRSNWGRPCTSSSKTRKVGATVLRRKSWCREIVITMKKS